MKPGAGRKAGPRPARPSGLFLLLQKKNKMDIFSSFATDTTLENEGKWFPLSKTAKVKVARIGNDRYKALMQAKLKEAQLGDMPDKEANELAEVLLTEAMASTVLVNWSGLTYQGKEAPYSTELALTFLNVKDFRKKIADLANNLESFRVKEEVAQGNA